jgi:hypothetical protein
MEVAWHITRTHGTNLVLIRMADSRRQALSRAVSSIRIVFGLAVVGLRSSTGTGRKDGRKYGGNHSNNKTPR